MDIFPNLQPQNCSSKERPANEFRSSLSGGSLWLLFLEAELFGCNPRCPTSPRPLPCVVTGATALDGETQKREATWMGASGEDHTLCERACLGADEAFSRFLSTSTTFIFPKLRGFLSWLRRMPTNTFQIWAAIFNFNFFFWWKPLIESNVNSSCSRDRIFRGLLCKLLEIMSMETHRLPLTLSQTLERVKGIYSCLSICEYCLLTPRGCGWAAVLNSPEIRDLWFSLNWHLCSGISQALVLTWLRSDTTLATEWLH